MATTKILLVGNGAGSWTPTTTATVTVECWGAGEAGNDSTGAGGIAGGYAKKNSLSVTAGTPVPFNLGAPGLGVPAGQGGAGGSTWFSAVGTVIAAGGRSGTTKIGDVVAVGGNGGTYNGVPGGGGGAGGP